MNRFTYAGNRLNEISFPLGGIGTGCIGLAGNGRLVDWEIAGKPNKGSLNGFTHFAVRAERDGQVLDARVLQGDLHAPYAGERAFAGSAAFGFGPRRENMAGVPHFRDVEFRGEFPMTELRFEGSAFPGRVSMAAFNPFIPLNDVDSGIPAALFEVTVANPTHTSIRYTVAGALSNPLKPNNIHIIRRAGKVTLLHLSSDGYGEKEFGAGDLTLATDAAEVSFQQYWFRGAWFDNLEVYWRNFTTPGPMTERMYAPEKAGGKNTGMLAAHMDVAPGSSATVRFVITWNFPWFEKYWEGDPDGLKAEARKKGIAYTWKHYYATLWEDSSASARYAMENWNRLHRETLQFKDALFASTLPEAALEAVSANLSILKSPTVLRLTDGTLYGWEGVGACSGCCEGSCTHVWNYAQAFPFLFPALERSMRVANYRHNQDEHGGMRFRTQLPLGIGYSGFRPCADGQFGDVMKTYRDWKICGDVEWVRGLWPKIKKSIEYAWSEHNPDRWDPEKTGVLWGRQHHTLDVELFGPNSWLTGYYLGALKAAAEMADALGDAEFASECRALFVKGKAWTDANLFNGEYYHQMVDLKEKSIAERFDAMNYWNEECEELKYQIAEGCEIDQVIAQWHANLYGLGEILDPEQVKTALISIFKYNFRPEMREYFNACRLYALNDEGGLVICHWPEEKHRPMTPLPYAGETQNGYEWAACIQMIQAGLEKEGLTCVKAIRDRYDGEKRNPWNEFECGSNYARSMASYALLNAYSGFRYDMRHGMIGFDPVRMREGRFHCFWCLSTAWGEFQRQKEASTLRILYGRLSVRQIDLPRDYVAGVRDVRLNERSVLWVQGDGSITFESTLTLRAGDLLEMVTSSRREKSPSNRCAKRTR